MKIRRQRKHNPTPSVMALDAQSVKWGNRLSDNDYDTNKKVKGIKRTISVERNECILGRTVSSAGTHDSHLASTVCEQVADAWPTIRKGLLIEDTRGRS